MKMKWYLIPIMLLLVAGAFILIVIQPFDKPIQKTMSKVKDNELDEAVEIYGKKIHGTELERDFVSGYESYLEEFRKQFESGQITYGQFNSVLDGAMEFGNSSLCKKARELSDWGNNVNESRRFFADAEQLFQNGDYAGAEAQYRHVSAYDVGNYMKAQVMLEECRKRYAGTDSEKTDMGE